MKKSKMQVRFHNPNTAEATADYLLRLFIEVNRQKAEQAVAAARSQGGTAKPPPNLPER